MEESYTGLKQVRRQNPLVSVANNAVWAMGELTTKIGQQMEPYAGVPKATMLDVVAALPGGQRATVGVLGDSFMLQALDAMACDLRQLGLPQFAGFLDWDEVIA